MLHEGNAKILCVDDEKLNLKLLQSILEPEGYEFQGAESGESALTQMVQERPDLVLLDIMMPKMTGFEVLRKLRADENMRLIPIVMITALRETEDKVKALAAGCDDFISKPFDKGELLARVKSLLRIKSLHDEVGDNYKKLKELERLKDALVHMLIHDLKNPLTIISGGFEFIKTRMVLDDNISDEAIRKDLEMVFSAIQRLLWMIDSLLDINKMEEGRMQLKYEEFNLCDMVREVVEHMKITAEAKEKILSLGPTQDMPLIFADKELIKRVMINLINNALKFVPIGGAIDLRVFYIKKDDNFCVQVIDTGSGIPREYLGKIFDKFFQVETQDSRKRKGTGLGLTFCRLAVEAHGGRIWAESELGKSSTFTIILPNKPSAI